MELSMAHGRIAKLLTAFLTLSLMLISTLAFADAPYRWPKDKNTNGFSYFVDDPWGGIWPMSSSNENDWYDEVDFGGGETIAYDGVGIGKNPETGRWEMRAKDGWCTKLALHPMGDLADPEKRATVLRLSALALEGGANVRIWTSPSLDPTSGDMPDPSQRTTLFEGRYRNGERVIYKAPLDELSIEHCHWIVVEVGDPKNDCDQEIEPPEDPDGGNGGINGDPDDPEHGDDDDDDDDDDDFPNEDEFEYRSEQCPLLKRIYSAGDVSTGKKFVEIYNPNGFPLELSHYYLGNRNDYYKFVSSSASDRDVAGATNPDGSLVDPTAFNIQFPERSLIPAKGTQVIAMTDSAGYAGNYGKDPDYELTQDGEGDGVPDMRGATINTAIPGFGAPTFDPDSADRVPASSDLARGDGTLVLYYWDQYSDRIYDCDIANWGTDPDVRIDKTGVSVDGPDRDSIATLYRDDTPVAIQSNIDDLEHPEDAPYRRKDALTEDGETLFGGNGMFGHDETSENMRSSWLVGSASSGSSTSGGCQLSNVGQAASGMGFLLFMLPLGLYLWQRKE